jgi:phage shock protein E
MIPPETSLVNGDAHNTPWGILRLTTKENPMPVVRRLLAPLVLVLAIGLGVSACAPTTEPIALEPGTVIIDVRTADEFASGHLDGALNLDVQSAAFDQLVAELPRDGVYVVYCRSGNRSAAAVERMANLGFVTLIDAGGLEAAAAATGIDIVG